MDYMLYSEFLKLIIPGLPTFFAPFLLQYFSYRWERNKVIKAILSFERFRKTLGIEIKKFINKYFWSALVEATALFILFNLNLFSPSLTLVITLYILLPFVFLNIVFSFIYKKSSLLDKFLDVYLLAFGLLIMMGVTASYFVFYLQGKNYFNYLLFSAFFLFLMCSLLPLQQKVSILEKEEMKNLLKRKIRDSPTFNIFTSLPNLPRVSGKIVDLYSDDFLTLKKGKKEIKILWKDIKAIECY